MSSDLCQCKDNIRRLCAEAGACATGFAAVTAIPERLEAAYARWLAEGRHASMEYMERYCDIRRDPSLLLEGARTVVVCAFAYTGPGSRRHPLFADYALGRDYHEVLRKRLRPVAAAMEAMAPGSSTRICVDTAPIRERFWATRAGIGVIGLNNHLIVPGIGSRVFLAEILWTHDVEPDSSLEEGSCCGCRACIVSCPAKALDGEGSIDCRRCLSYLTIEHRGDFPDGLTLDGRIYGCDVCQDVCPHNRNTRRTTVIEEFEPSEALMALDADAIAKLDRDGFSAVFSHSAVKRAKAEGLRRNIMAHISVKQNVNTTDNDT